MCDMNNDDKSGLWIGAFRYYCGRMTISVHSFCDLLINEWPNLPHQAKSVIERDLKQAIADDDRDRERGRYSKALGHDMDRAKWLEVWEAIQ